MLESRTTRWSLACAGICVLVLVAAYFLLVSPRRSEAAELRTQTESVESRASVLQQQIAELTAQFGDLDKKRAQLAALRTQLPTVADVPRLLRGLRSNADASGVDLLSITPSAPVALTGSNGQASASGVVSIPIVLTFNGSYVESTLFVKYLQTRLQRSFLITGVQVETGDEPTGTSTGTATGTTGSGLDSVDITVNAEVFALPDATVPAPVAPAAAAPAGTTATPAPAATTSPGTAPSAAPSVTAATN